MKGPVWAEQWLINRLRTADSIAAIVADMRQIKIDRYHAQLKIEVRAAARRTGLALTSESVEDALDHIENQRVLAEQRLRTKRRS